MAQYDWLNTRIAIYLIHLHTHCALKYGLPEKLGLCDYQVSLSQYFISCLKFYCKLHLDQSYWPTEVELSVFQISNGAYDLLENRCLDDVINSSLCFVSLLCIKQTDSILLGICSG